MRIFQSRRKKYFSLSTMTYVETEKRDSFIKICINNILAVFSTCIVSKHYRSDLKMWEEKRKFIKLIPYFVYKIGNKENPYKIHKKVRLFMLKPKKAILIKAPLITEVYIGRDEFEKVYQSNKWLIPMNYTLDLEKP